MISLPMKPLNKNSRVSRALDSSRVEMSSLCPHQFQEYLKKVSEILETYKPQILASVQYKDISVGLLTLKVIKRREDENILKIEDGEEQMAKVLHIIKKRMWGLENFMTALIEGKKETWLSEELFQAYVRHLVVYMKKLQKDPICECFHGGKNSVLYKSWLRALDSFDGHLETIGSSLGFLTLTMHPVNGLLDFIRKRLPISRQPIVTVTQADAESSESSEEETEPNELEWDSTGDFHRFEPDQHDPAPNASLDLKPQRSTQESQSRTARPRINPTTKSAQNATASKVVRPRSSTSSTQRSKIPPSGTSTLKKSVTPKPPIIARKIAPEKTKPILIRRAEPSRTRTDKSESSHVQTSSAPSPSRVRRHETSTETQKTTLTAENADTANILITPETTDTVNTTNSEAPDNELELDAILSIYDSHTPSQFEKLYSISLGTSFGSEEELRQDQSASSGPYVNKDEVAVTQMRDLTASPVFNSVDLIDEDDDYIDDDAFLPHRPPVSSMPTPTQSLGIITASSDSNAAPHALAHPISKAVRINGNIKTLEDTPLVCTSGPVSTSVEKSTQIVGHVLKDEYTNMPVAAEVQPKLIETKNTSTQTIVADPEPKPKLDHEPEPVKKTPVECASICTQTTPPCSPLLNRRSNSYPGGLSERPVHFLINPNVFQSFDGETGHGQATIMNPDPYHLSTKPVPETKPFLRKKSGHTSTVRKIINSAVSALKHSSSSSSEKKLLRTMSTSSSSSAPPKTKAVLRSASVSTATSATMPRTSLVGKPAVRPTSTDISSTRPASAEISSARKPSTEKASSTRPSSVDMSSSTGKGSVEKSSSIRPRPLSTSAVPAIAKKLVPSLNKGKVTNPLPVTKPKPVVTPRVPVVPLRQRVHAEIRENKANAPPPPPPVNQERLAPNDYNLQQLSNAWVAKQNKIEAENAQNNNNNNNG